jgi:hypothetical protein
MFAPLAALLTVQVTIWESVSRGLQRVAGVVIGVLLAYGFVHLAGINAWTIAWAIFVSFVVGRALRLGQQGSVQVPVSALVVLALGAATKGYGLDRVVDTAIGAGFGIAVNAVIVSRPHVERAEHQVRAFADGVANLLVKLAAGVLNPAEDWASDLAQARELGERGAAAIREVRQAETALRWNSCGRRDRPAVERLEAAAEVIDQIDRPTSDIAQVLADTPAGWSIPDGLAAPLAALLRRVAYEFSSWATVTTSVEAPGGRAGPAGAVEPGQLAGGPSHVDVAVLYHAVLTANPCPPVTPEAAAVALSIALAAIRINAELNRPREGPLAARRGGKSIFAS